MRTLAPNARITTARLLGGALLACLLLVMMMNSYHLTFAQSSAIEYAEKRTDPVATFTAVDPEMKDVYWNLSGTDAADFEIDDGVLSFATVPNYEAPADNNTDNTYEVTVEACDVSPCDASTATGSKSTREVMVEVTNVDEPGKVMLTVVGTGETTGALPVLVPQVDVVLTAALSDVDLRNADGGTVTLEPEWQWYRGSVSDSNKISGATNAAYTPTASDVGNRLIAKATYKDGEDANNDKDAEEPTLRAVRTAPGSNSAPTFPDQDPGTSGDQKEQEREVVENTPAGMNIGDPVAANDAGDVLAYSLSGADAAMFDIDIATGQLKTKGKLNREATDGESHTVIVTAMDPFGINDAATVTIAVENEDESPVIGASARAMIMHDEPVLATGTPVALATYTATDDEDDAANTVLTWDVKGADEAKFSISSVGVLTFVANPDFEKPGDANEDNVYEVTVVVEDADDNTDELAVRVEVGNVSEAGTVTFSVNTPRVAVPVTAMLSDPDGGETGHEWQWMVADNANAADDDKTDVEGATSATFTPRDEDLGKFLSVKVEYTDGEGEDEAEAELAIAIAASAAPRFYDSATPGTRKAITELEIELTENTVTDKDLMMGQIFVDDREDDETTVLRYAVGGTDSASFEIDTSGGTVQLKATGQLDREDKASYAVTVTATDSDANRTTLPVTIEVTNVDEAPDVSGATECDAKSVGTGYECEYAEKRTDPVATFTAVDPEMKDVYWNLSGTDAADFEIDDGVLSFATVPNYEAPADNNTDNTYEVTVEACDVSPCDASTATGSKSTREVMVEVTNVDEPGKVMLTVVGTGETTGALPVLVPQVDVVLTAALSDVDLRNADGGTVTLEPEWQWYRGSVSDSNKISGATNAAYTPTASDVGNRLIAKATYKDGEDANNDKDAEEPTLRAVRTAPGSNSAPTFPDQDPGTSGDQKEQEREVVENTPAGMNIGDPVAANDAGDVLAYSLSGADAAMFDIDIATGQLKTKGKLNREATDGESHTVIVTAMDPFGINDAATVTIAVENEDESPVIGASARAMIMHDEPVLATGTPVALATYTATDDEDDAANTVLTWDVKGADEAKFSISSVGVLTFVANPDFEKPGDANEDNVYEVTVVVEDADDNTDELAVRVEVGNVSEAGTVTFSVNTPRVAVPVTAMLSDPDGGETGHEWQWMVADNANAADDDKTDVEGATSATFTPRDEDLGKFLSVKVEYTDGEGEDEAEAELAIAIAASAAPRFYDSATPGTRKAITELEIELTENTVTDKDLMMGQIFVDDREDDETTVLRYAVGGTDSASFEIDTSGGTVQLKATGQLDREDKASYAVTVTATDSDANRTTLPVTIEVTNVDEAPEITLGGLVISGLRSIPSAENNSATLATYTSTGPESASTTWSLSGDDAGDFSISSSGGELSFAGTPDFENPADADGDNVYEVTIEAADGTYTAAPLAVTVTVTNKNEDGTVTFSADPQVGVELTASLTDLDGNESGMEWQWARDDGAGGFEDIAGATSAAYTPVAEDAGKQLRATVTYTDGEGSGKSAEAETSAAVAAEDAGGVRMREEIRLEIEQAILDAVLSDGVDDAERSAIERLILEFELAPIS